MKIVEPRFHIPHCTTIARACMKIYSNEVDILRRAFVGQRVCVTTDTWTPIQNLNYIFVIAHFIDGDLIYQKKPLNFFPIANFKGDTIGRAIESCLLKWGIDWLFTIIVNNANSNDVVIDYVKKKIKERDSSILGGEFIHMRCCVHILNLIVQNGLKFIHELIVKVRNVVRYVRASLVRFEKFQECVKMRKLKLNVCCFLMCQQYGI